MSLIDVKNISHSFGDKLLYTDSSFELYKGEHMGLVGQNGTGKTTLLNSIIGEIVPDRGEIKIQKGINLGYLDQHAKVDTDITIFDYLKTAFDELFSIENKLNLIYENMATDNSEKTMNKASNYQHQLINRGFYEIESTILKVAAGLGITSLGMETKLRKLSDGQRAKVILAKLLLENPDLLLLDEPTNFLDKEHIAWLTDYLKSFEGAFIVISHDFDFLDKITDCILDIEFFNMTKYNGNFSKFIELKGLKRENYIREYESQQKQIKRLEIYIAKNKVRASTANMAKSRQKQLDKIEKLLPPETPPKPHFRFTSMPITSDKTLIVNDLEIGYYYPLLPKLNFEILSKQKVIITGFNGIGKSTLLNTLTDKIPKLSGSFKFSEKIKIGYFEQDFEWESDDITPIQIVSRIYPEYTDKQVRAFLAQCGLKAKSSIQAVSTLSGGEQSKVKLCILMLTKCNLLILDEPTNHLDADTKEVLKNELKKWQGSLILVTHESSFYKGWYDKIINIESLFD